jgi:hypothetical protein
MNESVIITVLAGAIALGGCSAAPDPADAARQAEIDRFCRAPRTSSGTTEAIAQCGKYFRTHPEVRLPNPADVPLPGEPGYDPPIGEAWPFCPSCA